MIYDDNTLKSFTERAMENYLLLTKHGTEYDITITLCTLCGILSMLDESVRKDIFADFKIPEYCKPLPSFKVDPKKDSKKENLAIIRHFRNSLCHFKLDGTHVKANKNGQIEKIIFEDYYKESLNFSCSLTAEEMKLFLADISNQIISRYKA